jgi:hypothetical protein
LFKTCDVYLKFIILEKILHFVSRKTVMSTERANLQLRKEIPSFDDLNYSKSQFALNSFVCLNL